MSDTVLAKALAAAGLVSGDVSERAREARSAFLRDHAEAVYDELTGNRSRFVRIDELVTAAARQFPGLVPAAQHRRRGGIAAEPEGRTGDRPGHVSSAILRSRRSGTHLCHAMLLPQPESLRAAQVHQGRSPRLARRLDRAARQGGDR